MFISRLWGLGYLNVERLLRAFAGPIGFGTRLILRPWNDLRPAHVVRATNEALTAFHFFFHPPRYNHIIDGPPFDEYTE